MINNTNPEIQQLEVHKSGSVKGKEHSKNANFTMAVLVYLLIQAAMTSTEGTLARAKQLNANGLAQEALNREEEKIQWDRVPKLKTNVHTKTIWHWHWTARFWRHGGFHYRTKQVVKWKTHPNQGAVEAAEEKNQQHEAERQMLTQEQMVLQQMSEVQSGHINSLADESVQTMQLSQGILKMVRSLTFKALMRQEPQF